MNQDTYLLEGNISVKAAILQNRRIVYEIIVDETKRDKDTQFILHKAKENNIMVKTMSRNEIDVLAQGKTHGGMLAKVGERTFQSLSDCTLKENVYLALIEGIEDPFNFGYLLRTFYAAGVDAVIIPERNWTSSANVVTRASAGASEAIDLIIATDMDNVLKTLEEQAIPMYCAERKDAQSLYETRFPTRLCIAIGGEMRGLSKKVKDAATQNIYIPYGREVRNALNAASAAAVFSFEVMRQRQK